MFGGADASQFDVVDGWRAVAIADYQAATPEEISFEEDDQIVVETQNENGWWVGSNRKSKQRGIFPGSYVEVTGSMKVKVPKAGGGGGQATIGGAPGMGGFDSEAAINVKMDMAIARARVKAGDEDPQLWNWDTLSRDDAVRVLQGHPEGTFLVRASTTQANSYSISVVQNHQVRHIRIVHANGGYSINTKDRPCSTIAELIRNKMGEKLKSQLHGSGQSVESRLLVAPLPNPKRQQEVASQQQAPPAQAYQPPPQQLHQQQPMMAQQAPPPAGGGGGGFGLAAPPSAKRSGGAAANDPYARQRGGQGQVAATSLIKQPDQAKIGQSRVLKAPPGGTQDPFAAQGGGGGGSSGDPFATGDPAPAPAPAPVPVQQPKHDFLTVLQHVWTKAGPVDNKLGGAQLRPIMLMSKLENAALGQIWAMVDTEKTGTIDYKQLGFLLGLVGQAQRGEALNISAIGPTSVPPTLEGLQIP